MDVGSAAWIPASSTQARYNVPGELMYGNGRAVWLPVTLSSMEDADNAIFVLEWDPSVKVKVKLNDAIPRDPMGESSVDDIVQLQYPNEGSILSTLGEHFRSAHLVMRLGRYFVCVNPVNRVSREQGSHRNSTADMSNRCNDNSSSLDVYAIAEEAKKTVSESLMDQTIILRGCSGSGKTELSKRIIQYLLFVENPRRDGQSTSIPAYEPLGHAMNPYLVTSPESRVSQALVAASLVMDAFGSAPTERCPTSSRLIRTTRLAYNMRGKLQSASTSYLLLDDTRISVQNIQDSHPFNIFAWLTLGSGADLRNEFKIPAAITGEFESHSIASSPTYVDDVARNLEHLRSLLESVGMPGEAWADILKIIAAVMHLQRLAVSGSDAATISSATKNHVLYAETILGMETGTLGPVLLKKSIDISGTKSYKNLTQEDSKAAIFTLGVELYTRAFNYLLRLCNDYSSSVGEGARPGGPTLQIIDVNGNENFSTPPNALPQFCCNLVEEKFNEHLIYRSFQREIEFLRMEGVEAPPVGDVADPEPMAQLLDVPPTGIVSLLEEACLFPRGNDNALLDKIFSTHSKGKLVKTAGRKEKNTCFVVKHTFGEVTYDIDGFVAANKTRLPPDVKTLIQTVLIRTFPFLASDADVAADEEQSAPKGRRAMDKSALKAAFIANQTRDQTKKLIDSIGGSEKEGTADPMMVFCVRGSADLKSFTFDPSYSAPQVRFLNLTELAAFFKKGFAHRQHYREFYERYRVMFPYSFDGLPWKMLSEGDNKALTRGLLRECASLACIPNLLADEAIAPVFGNTFIFLKERLIEILDGLRSDVLKKFAQAVVLIQAGSRMKLSRTWFTSLRRGIMTVQTVYRMWVCRTRFRNTLNSARRIQGFYLMKKMSSKYKQIKGAVMTIKRRLLDKMVQRIRYKRLQRATRVLHHLSRGFVIRQQINHVIRAVLKLQTFAKDFIKRNRLYYFRRVAIVRIQRVFRGSYVRHLNRPIVRALKIRKSQRVGTAAVKKLQSAWRMQRVRKRFLDINNAARTIQMWSISRKQREIYLKQLVVVRWLQCTARRVIATNTVNSLRVREMVKQEAIVLRDIRDMELSSVAYKNISTEKLPDLRIGGGYYRNAHDKFGRYLIGLDVTFDISMAYPKGWVKTLLNFDDKLRKCGQRRLWKVAIGRTHTILVDTYSSVYTFGLGDNGQLGHGTRANEVEPRPLDTLGYQSAAAEGRGIARSVAAKVDVLNVCAGRDHTLLLTGSRRVYSWGGNRRGQLGHSDCKDSALPRIVHGPKNVRVISCGSYHSACLADPGILYTWGARECLGRMSDSDSSTARTLPFFNKRRVQLMVCGDAHVTVRSGADFYSWGVNTHGQLGSGVEEGASIAGEDEFDNDTTTRHQIRGKDSCVPVLVDIPSAKWSEADQMSAILVAGGKHMLLAVRNHLWAWGWNKFGQIGCGHNDDVFSPVRIPLNGPKFAAVLQGDKQSLAKKHTTIAGRITHLVAGWRHSMALTKGGVVYVWGVSGLHDSTTTPAGSSSSISCDQSVDINAKAASPVVSLSGDGSVDPLLDDMSIGSKDSDISDIPPLCPPALLTPHILGVPNRLAPYSVLGLFSCCSSTFSLSALELEEKDAPKEPLRKQKYISKRTSDSLLFHEGADVQREITERVRTELGPWSYNSKAKENKDASTKNVEAVKSSSAAPPSSPSNGKKSRPSPQKGNQSRVDETHRSNRSKEGQVTHEGLLQLFSPVKRPVTYTYQSERVNVDDLFRIPDEFQEPSTPEEISRRMGDIARRNMAGSTRRRASAVGVDAENISISSKARKRRTSVLSLHSGKSGDNFTTDDRSMRAPRRSSVVLTGQKDPVSRAMSVEEKRKDRAAALRRITKSDKAKPSGMYSRLDEDVDSLGESIQSIRHTKARAKGSSPLRVHTPSSTMLLGELDDTQVEDGENEGLSFVAVSDLATMIQGIKKESLKQMSMSWRH